MSALSVEVPTPAVPTLAPARGLAVAAMVTGIVASVLGLIPLFALFALAGGIVALTLGLVAARKQKAAGFKRPMARAGWILGIVAIVLGVVGMAIVDQAFDDLERDLNEIEAEYQP
jgi:hypothetical protein